MRNLLPIAIPASRAARELSDSVLLGVGVANGGAEAGCGRVWSDDAAGGVECAVKEHRLDPDVVVRAG